MAGRRTRDADARPATSMGLSRADHESARPQTSDGVRRSASRSEVSINIDVGISRQASRPQTALGLSPAYPGTTKGKLGKKVLNLDPFVLPAPRACAKDRLKDHGGVVPATTGIAWDWQKSGPYLTSMVLDSPRGPDFTIDLCMDDDRPNRPSSPQRDALRAGILRLCVGSPVPAWYGQERARVGDFGEDGLTILTAQIEELTRKKMDLLVAADRRSRFSEIDDNNMLDDPYDQSNDLAEFEELNTLRRNERVVLRVKETSEHLLATKGEKKIAIKVRSFKERLDELEKKIAIHRTNREPLRKKVVQIKRQKHERNGGGTQIKEFREKLTAGAFSPDKMAELRTLRMLQEEIRVIAAQKKKRELLKHATEVTVEKIEEKAAKKEAMRIEAERKRLVARTSQLVQVLLPAAIAASRFALFCRNLKEGRIERKRLEELGEVCIKIQRHFKWKMWTIRFKQKAHAKRVLRKCMWQMMMNWRIRRKSSAVRRIKAGLREYGQTLEVVAAFKRYKYKIRLLQRRMRSVIASFHSQVLASKSQYHKTRNHYKSLQVTGGQAPTSPKDKDGAKKPMKKKKTSSKPSENVKGVNFLILPDANNEVASRELTALVKRRRYEFACHISRWREEYAEWEVRKGGLEEKHKEYHFSEVQTARLLGNEPRDFSQEPVPKGTNVPSLSSIHEIQKSTGFPMLYDREGNRFSWGRFLSLDEDVRYKDERYRMGGPPRPMFKVALDLEDELLPLYARVHDQTSSAAPL